MKKILLLILFFFLSFAHASEQTASIETFQGGVDVISPDKLNISNAPFTGLLNIRTDEYSQITKRYGTVKYNTIPMTGSLKTRNAFTFNQNNGNSYIITVSSSSVFASLSGTFTTIISTRSLSGRDRFAVGQNKLFGCNGINAGWSWDGTNTTIYDVTNSTGFPTGKYVLYWQQRLWISGDSNYPSRLYYSEGGQPTNFQNFIDIATDDGDQITGMMIGADGSMIVTKNYATYTIYQYETGGFAYLQKSPSIGCLYDTTMCIFNGLSTWMSSRGIEQFNGSTFSEPPLTAPIDNYFKSLTQISVSQNVWQHDTSGDWGAGSGTNIDTTTYSGSVSIISNYGVWNEKTVASVLIGVSVSSDGTKQAVCTAGGIFNNYIYVSTDTGNTWSAKGNAGNWSCVAMSADGKVISACNYPGVAGYIYVSTDTGNTWYQAGTAQNYTSIAVSSDGSKQTAVADNGYIYVSSDTGKTWNIPASILSYGPLNWTSVAMSLNGTRQTAAGRNIYQNSIFVSEDSGASWITYGRIDDNCAGIAMTADGSTQTICGLGTWAWANAYIYKSLDYGHSWSKKNIAKDWSGISISADGKTVLASDKNNSNGGYIYESFDGGNTWSTTSSGAKDWTGVALSADGSKQFATTFGNKVYINTTTNFPSSGSFTSQTFNATNWGSWGTFSVTDSQPSGSSISYYVKTSTASDDFSTKAAIPVSNGSAINTTVGSYIQVISSFTRTDLTAIPLLNSFNISYYGTNDNVPFQTVFNRKLYCAVESPGTSSGNDTVLVLQKDGTWTKDTMSVGAFAVNRSNLYYGSSTDNGFVYRSEVPNVYSDDGVGYPAYWTSKPIWVHPYERVSFKDIWIQGEGTDSNLDIGYALNENSNGFTSKSIMTGSMPFWKKMPLPLKTGRAVQIKIGDFTGISENYFKINRLYLTYDNQLSLE